MGTDPHINIKFSTNNLDDIDNTAIDNNISNLYLTG